MDQKFKFVGTRGYGDSHLESLFCRFEVITLHAILHDAARAVGVQSPKRPGYCYMFGGRAKSCLRGHLPGQLFRPYVKIFLPSIINSVDI